jgi:hypothetical protein
MSKKNKNHYEVYEGPVSTDADIEAMIAAMVSSGEVKTKGAAPTAPENVFVPKQKSNKKHDDVADAIASALNVAASTMSQVGRKADVIASPQPTPIPQDVIEKCTIRQNPSISDPKPVPSDIGQIKLESGRNRYGDRITFRDQYQNAITTQIYPKSAETAAIDVVTEADLRAMINHIYLLLKLEMYPDCVCTPETIQDTIKDISPDNIIVTDQNGRYFVYIVDENYVDSVFAPKFTSIIEHHYGSVVGTVISLINTFNEVPTLREFVLSEEDMLGSQLQFSTKVRDIFPTGETTKLEDVDYNLESMWEGSYAEIFNIISKLQEQGSSDAEDDYEDPNAEDVDDDYSDDEDESEDDYEDEDEEETGVSNDNDSFRDESNGSAEDVSANGEPVGNTSGADEVQTDFEPFAEEVQPSTEDNDTESDDKRGGLTVPLGDVLKNAGFVGGSTKAEQSSGSTPAKKAEEVKEETSQKELGRSTTNKKAEEKKEEKVDDMVINIQTVGRK